VSSLADFFPAGAVDAINAHVEAEVRRQLDDRRLVTIKEFARASGLSEKAVRRRAERRQLQTVRVGGRLLIPLTELGLQR
jgi:RNA-binding protein YhbY